jgi:uncharacterized membrane protein
MDQYLEPEKFKLWTRWTQGLYIMYGLALLTFGLTAIVAVFLNYIKNHSVAGTIFESHFQWQIRTFWVSLLGLITGVVSLFFLVGQLILLGTVVWVLYRVGWGWYRLQKKKPMYG